MAELIIALGFFPMAVTKVTDFIRNLFDKNDSLPKWVWNVVPLGLGVATALLYELNYSDLIPNLPPKLQGLEGVSGQIVTGLALGAVASFWHELMDYWSSSAKLKKFTGTQS